MFDVFLQVIDDGRLTDSKGRLVDFSHCYVILTSNAKDTSGFKPEFLNRLDRVLTYNKLDRASLILGGSWVIWIHPMASVYTLFIWI